MQGGYSYVYGLINTDLRFQFCENADRCEKIFLFSNRIFILTRQLGLKVLFLEGLQEVQYYMYIGLCQGPVVML